MTRVRAFRGLRYDPERVSLDRVLVPPYDVVAPDEREGFYARDPHNAIRLELTRDVADEADADYADVAATLAAWRREGVLVREAAPALYGLRQRFRAPDGSEKVREGFFAELRLEDYASRVVLPHERTMRGPKADRLKMLRATRANLSVIFLLYEDREHAVADALAGSFASGFLARGVDPAGVENTLVRVDAAAAVERVCGFLSERPVVIADGHHRYETALAYRDENPGDPAAGWTLAYFANAFAPGTLLLPIHRVIVKGTAPQPAAWAERLPGWSQPPWTARFCRLRPVPPPEPVCRSPGTKRQL